jgi:hypothetical protein
MIPVITWIVPMRLCEPKYDVANCSSRDKHLDLITTMAKFTVVRSVLRQGVDISNQSNRPGISLNASYLQARPKHHSRPKRKQPPSLAINEIQRLDPCHSIVLLDTFSWFPIQIIVQVMCPILAFFVRDWLLYVCGSVRVLRARSGRAVCSCASFVRLRKASRVRVHIGCPVQL